MIQPTMLSNRYQRYIGACKSKLIPGQSRITFCGSSPKASEAPQQEAIPTVVQYVFEGNLPQLETPSKLKKLGVALTHPVSAAKGIWRDRKYFGVLGPIFWAITCLKPKDYIEHSHIALELKRNRQQVQFSMMEPLGLLKQGKLDEALKTYKKAIEAEPNHWQSWYTLANFCNEVLWIQLTMKGEQPGDRQWLNGYIQKASLHSPYYWGEKINANETVAMGSQETTLAKQPVNVDALTESLKSSVIPFGKIADEAYREASRLVGKMDELGMMKDVQEFSEAMSHFYQNKPEEAKKKLTALIESYQQGCLRDNTNAEFLNPAANEALNWINKLQSNS